MARTSLRLTAVPLLMLVVACVHERSSRPAAAEPATNPASAAVAATPPPPEPAPTQTNAPTNPPPAPATQPPGGQSGPVTAPTRQSPATNPAVTPRAPATAAIPSTSAAVAAPSPPRPPVAAAPALDLKGLEQRLRDTNAIGLFTKLSLKNQVDDLLAQFRAFHQGQSRNTLDQLRQKYELLLMKVVSLLQDGDPALANAVLFSREAIWSILTDPKKFAAI